MSKALEEKIINDVKYTTINYDFIGDRTCDIKLSDCTSLTTELSAKCVFGRKSSKDDEDDFENTIWCELDIYQHFRDTSKRLVLDSHKTFTFCDDEQKMNISGLFYFVKKYDINYLTDNVYSFNNCRDEKNRVDICLGTSADVSNLINKYKDEFNESLQSLINIVLNCKLSINNLTNFMTNAMEYKD